MSTDTTNSVPDLLFHTTLTVVDYHADPSGATRTVYVLGTRTTLNAAKIFAYDVLTKLNYLPDDFAVYETRAKASDAWTHGDGVLVYAKAPAGQIFLVGIDTKPNTESLPAGSDGEPLTPPGSHLHYVLQTTIDYNQDKSGAAQTTEIVGCYLKRAEAMAAALSCLADNKADFAEYDEKNSAEMAGEWPYGDEVIVHAVAQTGENYLVAVRTVSGAHQKHAKKQ